jgi:hypothetical protein
MSDEEQDVRAALRQRFGSNDREIQLMLDRYVGRHLTVHGFFRRWLEERLAEQASWMLDYINVELIAGAAVAKGRVVTIAAGRGVYVFMHKP